MHLVRITHPFHPLYGRELVYLGERYSRYGTKVLLELDDIVFAVPRQWTDLVAPDPEVVIGNERSVFRLRDLMALEQLVNRLCRFDAGGDEQCVK